MTIKELIFNIAEFAIKEFKHYRFEKKLDAELKRFEKERASKTKGYYDIIKYPDGQVFPSGYTPDSLFSVIEKMNLEQK